MKGISVVIPIKPPEPYVDRLIIQIHTSLRRLTHEILLQYEKGLTNAVIAGAERAQFDFVTVMDADGSHSPLYLEAMYILLDSDPSLDLVTGSKVSGNDMTPFHRRFISKIYRSLSKKILNLKISDPMSGFVMGKRFLFLDLQPSNDYKFLLQLLTHNPPPKTTEIPIIFAHRKAGKSKASLVTGFTSLYSILKLWWNK